MSHKEEREFCKLIKSSLPTFFENQKVLDVGSGDINGNNNYLFSNCHLTRVDLTPGPNVDMVSYAHDLTFVNEHFDTIISTECFEHDKHYVISLQNMVRMLRPGGLMLFTCATTGRPEHGTSKNKPWQVLSTRLPNAKDYYKNLEESDIEKAINVDSIFIEHEFSEDPFHHDLFFWGIKR